MGRARNKYRPKPTIVTDDSELRKIQVDISDDGKYDASNALVLPSKKRATKKLRDLNAQPVKLLSKKKRKKLEKIVEQKEKKANRASLLEALQGVKADPHDLARLTQLQATQTLGRRKFMAADYTVVNNNNDNDNTTTGELVNDASVLSGVKGRKRKYQQQQQQQHTHHHLKVKDPSIVQLGELSSSSEEEEEEEDDEEEEVTSAENNSTEQKEEKEMEMEEEEEEEEKDDSSPTQAKESSSQTTSQQQQQQQQQQQLVNTNTSQPDKKQTVRPAVFKQVNRLAEIQTARLKLPILAEEQVIMEAIQDNTVTVIVGTTGSGKTTQLPQFLYEAGYTSDGKMIGITEPRRVAAISMSQRVAYEMNLTSKQVSYQIRFEGNTTTDTKIKFMTDGVLLKEIQKDPTLKKYSVIIIDEAHERSVFSDILIGILSRIIPRREAKGKPLKLIIMSATLRIEDFTENNRLFKNFKPPVMKVDSRMFEVTIHYNKRTTEDYVGEAYKKACKIHRQLPEGGILIFVSGQQEVNSLVRQLRATFPLPRESAAGSALSGYQRNKLKAKANRKNNNNDNDDDSTARNTVLPQVKLESFVSALPDDGDGEEEEEEDDDGGEGEGGAATTLDDRDGALDSDLDLNDDDNDLNDGVIKRGGEREQAMWVLPLYSMLTPDKQKMVFDGAPEGMRLCVVSTNVAETSLTIPSVKYVVDSGKVKEKVYDKVTGVSMFHVTWTSQASANQRAGRAGRTAAGHCYRLYSSAVFNDQFRKFSWAEIERRPIDDLVLVMKAMNLPVINFPFPTPPDYLQVRHAIKRLLTLGALEETPDTQTHTHTTHKKPRIQTPKDKSIINGLGKAMAAFPLSPRYGKMLALSHQHSLLPYTVVMVAALTVPEVLTETPLDATDNYNGTQRTWQQLRRRWAGSGHSLSLGDVMVLVRAVGAAEYQGGGKQWCDSNGLRHKAITEIRKLRRQLTNEINLIIPTCNLILDPKMSPPTNEQARLLRQIVLAGSIDHVARRVEETELKTPEDKAKWRHAYRTQDMEEPVFLSGSCVLCHDRPPWVVYQEVQETHKMIMRNVTAIEPEWLAIYAPHLCTFSPPLETPDPHYDTHTDKILCHRKASFGASCWVLPVVVVEHPEGTNLYRWFAYHLLMGSVCTNLHTYTQHLHEPRTLVNTVAIRFREQRERLLRALMTHGVTTLSQLTTIWKQQPKYLWKEYSQWITDEDVKQEVLKIWPPINNTTTTTTL
ncbi:hypothetical protein Pmani_036961 [Petrolisthes manimaculis]|uniref:RNA helicase n=1 Tax=Petrolisthes manimaculis TaxID=1843537 RepID=A0AAE1NHB6_9EUCA|nr:hypothetical protein Pmani_036961 [Petrolisthes manimaculis]